MNTANALYAMAASAVLFYVIVGLAIFLFLWPYSQGAMLTLLAWGIGIGITVGIKYVLVLFFRKKNFKSFRRVRQRAANITSLALECWFIGLGAGVMLGRLCQFLLAMAFWIGRIDTPFLADSVSLLGYKFDYVPLNFVKELLVHESHRHPLIERLGAMYLMRLRHKGSFSARAGSCWRQLFIVALMPWLVKHRVFLEQRLADAMADEMLDIEAKLDEEKHAITNVTDAVANITQDVKVVVQNEVQV
jgi:hypothetical protein